MTEKHGTEPPIQTKATQSPAIWRDFKLNFLDPSFFNIFEPQGCNYILSFSSKAFLFTVVTHIPFAYIRNGAL